MLRNKISEMLSEQGFPEATLINVSSEQNDVGDIELIYKVSDLLLKFVDDRGELFLDVGSTNNPNKFYQFCDIAVLLGLKNALQVTDITQPEDVATTLATLKSHFVHLTHLFSKSHQDFTRARLIKIAKEREKVLVDKLRGK